MNRFHACHAARVGSFEGLCQRHQPFRHRARRMQRRETMRTTHEGNASGTRNPGSFSHAARRPSWTTSSASASPTTDRANRTRSIQTCSTRAEKATTSLCWARRINDLSIGSTTGEYPNPLKRVHGISLIRPQTSDIRPQTIGRIRVGIGIEVDGPLQPCAAALGRKAVTKEEVAWNAEIPRLHQSQLSTTCTGRNRRAYPQSKTGRRRGIELPGETGEVY